jgi:hypothetical protein
LNATISPTGSSPSRDDKREIFRARDAQKIADTELGFHPEYAAVNIEPPTTAQHAGAPQRRSLTLG